MQAKWPTWKQKITSNPAWVLVAAFGTYFCMYGFRKPYTAATYNGSDFLGVNYKFLLVIAQTIGYVAAKWVGIKFVSEIRRENRIKAILVLLAFAETMLLLFGFTPRPWNMLFLLLNGLPLGVIFGLVLGFLEGRKNSEFLIAGLCASFIVSDGVSKSVGAMLLNFGVPENWMPFFAGLVFLIPILLFISMLSAASPPSLADVESRSARQPMTRSDRWAFFYKYAPGLSGIILIYLFTTLLRSLRADFAVELWTGLGYKKTPALFTNSELIVMLVVLLITGMAVLIRQHHKAFQFSLFTSFLGFALIISSVIGLNNGLNSFLFMVLIGMGVYIPYVAVHAIIFERLIAITREKANVGFLMYVVDSVGYTGYIGLLILKYFTPSAETILSGFLKACLLLGLSGLAIIIFCYLYFKIKLKRNEHSSISFSAGQSSNI